MRRTPDPALQTRSTIVPNARALILCVERDPHIRELEAYFLDQAGFVVHFARDRLRRSVCVLKSRNSAHELAIRELEITSAGLRIGGSGSP